MTTSTAALRAAILALALVSSGQSIEAQANGCALLKPADLAGLLGGAPNAMANPTGCVWAAGTGTKRLVAITVSFQASGAGTDIAFTAARNAAAKGGAVTVTDEAGLGDKAFAALETFGVALVMLKQGRMLQLQYYPGAPGTAKDVEALRPVAKLAIAAF